MNSEVLIIGGGVIGLAIARSLHKKGVRDIAVLERGKVGREASFAAAGMLAPQSESAAPGAMFDLCSESRDLYPPFAAELLGETGIDIELEQSGTLVPAFNDEDERRHREIFEWQTAAGLKVEKLSAEEVLKREPLLSEKIKSGLFFPCDWQVDNRKLLAALAEFAEHRSIKLLENSPVDELVIENGKCIGVRFKNELVRSEKVVVATGAWTSYLKFYKHEFPVQVEPVRGQMISFDPTKPTFQHVIFSSNGYIVPRRNGKLIVGATVEHCGFADHTTEEGIEKLRQNAIAMAPFIGHLEIDDAWSGLRPKVSDDLPVIGRFDRIEDLFIATADFRNGILLAPITGEIIAEAIADEKDPKYFETFSPERNSLMSQKAV